MNNIALLALEASDGAVVLTSITLVFGMLVALCLLITVEGKIFDAMSGKGKKDKPAAPKAPAAAPAPQQNIAKAAAAPAVEGGIPGEIVAAIAAAVASLGNNLSIRGIRHAQPKSKGGSRRGAWGDAGVNQNTTPFM